MFNCKLIKVIQTKVKVGRTKETPDENVEYRK